MFADRSSRGIVELAQAVGIQSLVAWVHGGGCDAHGRVPLVEVEKTVVGSSTDRERPHLRMICRGKPKNPEKIRSSIITPLLRQAHTARNALARAANPNPGPRRSATTDMAEVTDSKSGSRKRVWVQVPPSVVLGMTLALRREIPLCCLSIFAPLSAPAEPQGVRRAGPPRAGGSSKWRRGGCKTDRVCTLNLRAADNDLDVPPCAEDVGRHRCVCGIAPGRLNRSRQSGRAGRAATEPVGCSRERSQVPPARLLRSERRRVPVRRPR